MHNYVDPGKGGKGDGLNCTK